MTARPSDAAARRLARWAVAGLVALLPVAALSRPHPTASAEVTTILAAGAAAAEAAYRHRDNAWAMPADQVAVWPAGLLALSALASLALLTAAPVLVVSAVIALRSLVVVAQRATTAPPAVPTGVAVLRPPPRTTPPIASRPAEPEDHRRPRHPARTPAQRTPSAQLAPLASPRSTSPPVPVAAPAPVPTPSPVPATPLPATPSRRHLPPRPHRRTTPRVVSAPAPGGGLLPVVAISTASTLCVLAGLPIPDAADEGGVGALALVLASLSTAPALTALATLANRPGQALTWHATYSCAPAEAAAHVTRLCAGLPLAPAPLAEVEAACERLTAPAPQHLDGPAMRCADRHVAVLVVPAPLGGTSAEHVAAGLALIQRSGAGAPVLAADLGPSGPSWQVACLVRVEPDNPDELVEAGEAAARQAGEALALAGQVGVLAPPRQAVELARLVGS